MEKLNSFMQKLPIHILQNIFQIEGEKVESPWKGKVLKSDELNNDACPICRLNLDIKYTVSL